MRGNLHKSDYELSIIIYSIVPCTCRTVPSATVEARPGAAHFCPGRALSFLSPCRASLQNVVIDIELVLADEVGPGMLLYSRGLLLWDPDPQRRLRVCKSKGKVRPCVRVVFADRRSLMDMPLTTSGRVDITVGLITCCRVSTIPQRPPTLLAEIPHSKPILYHQHHPLLRRHRPHFFAANPCPTTSHQALLILTHRTILLSAQPKPPRCLLPRWKRARHIGGYEWLGGCRVWGVVCRE